VKAVRLSTSRDIAPYKDYSSFARRQDTRERHALTEVTNPSSQGRKRETVDVV
jgi:hypothetical protein